MELIGKNKPSYASLVLNNLKEWVAFPRSNCDVQASSMDPFVLIWSSVGNRSLFIDPLPHSQSKHCRYGNPVEHMN